MALEDLMRYESAAVAGLKREADPLIAAELMANFYSQIGFDDAYVKEGLERDQEIIIRSIKKGEKPTLDNLTLKENILIYSDKYDNAFRGLKMSDLMVYLESMIYPESASNIPKNAKEGILEYKNITYEELINKAKEEDIKEEDKQKISNAIFSIEMLKKLNLEKRYVDIRTQNTEEQLKQLYSVEKEDKKK